ncbi:HNH/endonuclease VII fold putative polymorphic toxin [Ralstonia solanacearum]|uniref:HNH/endonuclease VII fold putative polymorphic toxin n=1 Tax=Ralstonia solanacearum TaxID=305 RepID=UPI0018D1875D
MYIRIYGAGARGGEQKIRIRDDAAGHFSGDGDAQNHGPHFNDQKSDHYGYWHKNIVLCEFVFGK